MSHWTGLRYKYSSEREMVVGIEHWTGEIPGFPNWNLRIPLRSPHVLFPHLQHLHSLGEILKAQIFKSFLLACVAVLCFIFSGHPYNPHL